MTDEQAMQPGPQPAGHAPEPIPGKCNGRNRSGGLCRNTAGKGTSHVGIGRCENHGGSTPTHVVSAQKAIAAAAVNAYGLPRTVDPRDALLEEVHRTAGAVAYLQARVAEVDEADLVWGKTHEDEQGATEFPGTNVRHEAKPNAWLVLYQQERKHLVDVCKTAIAAGIEERRVRVAEQLGAQLASVIRAFAEGLALTPEQWQLVPGLMQRILLPLTAGAAA